MVDDHKIPLIVYSSVSQSQWRVKISTTVAPTTEEFRRSVPYMAPELFGEDESTTRRTCPDTAKDRHAKASDVWAFGVTFLVSYIREDCS